MALEKSSWKWVVSLIIFDDWMLPTATTWSCGHEGARAYARGGTSLLSQDPFELRWPMTCWCMHRRLSRGIAILCSWGRNRSLLIIRSLEWWSLCSNEKWKFSRRRVAVANTSGSVTKSQNDPVFVYFIIFLAQIRRRSLDASLVNDSMTTLMKIVRGDFDPAFFHHHECLFHCYVAFAEVMMMLEGADAEKSFQVLVVALRKARYLWPGFRMMLCQHVKSNADHFGEE